MVVPELHLDVERPVLDSIPDLDVTDWTDKQISDVTVVLSAYNTNLGKLSVYVNQLEDAMALQSEYLNEVIVILNGR